MTLLALQMDLGTLGILFLVLLVLLGAFLFFVKKHSGNDDTTATTTVDDYVASHGEPIDAIVLDATRSNELPAVILVYDSEIVVDGSPIERDKITNVTFYNAGNPYMGNDYLLVITTSLPDRPTIETPIGNDAKLASDAVTRMADHLNLPT